MKHVKTLMIILFGINFSSFLSADTWKILFYMDSSDDLSDMAIKNITDMVRGKPNDMVDFVIQLHAYDATGLRYRVTSAGLVFLEEVMLSSNSKQDFIDAARWAFANHTCDHTMLIASDHGWGILDPRWNADTKKWEAGADALSNSCALKRSCFIAHAHDHHKRHKGFMFMANPRTYLNNQDLIEGLSHIKNGLLGGKQLDVFAFDTCMGDMFEVGYHIAPYVHYLVGSQSCSLRDGFDYQGIMHTLNTGGAPRDIASGMVESFEAYYKAHDASGVYTHAALDLSQLPQASNALDALVGYMIKLPADLLIKAVDAAPRFCMWPMYTDLIAFCRYIERELTADQLSAPVQAAFKNFYQAMQALIVARCGGITTQGRAYGVAIYLPTDSLDASYKKTVFARESHWVQLLEIIAKVWS